MVRQLIALKTKITWNTLSRQAWVMVMLILGLLYALSVFVGATLGVVFSIHEGFGQITTAILTLVGAVVIAGWWLVPALFSGMDNTLDPQRFAPYVGPSRRFAFGTVVATGIGVAGILTTLIFCLPVLGWILTGQWLAAIAAACAVPFALLTAFVWARTFSTWLGVRLRATSTRRDMSAAVSSIVFIAVVAPMGVWLQWLMRDFNAEMVASSANIVSWLPFGAIWGVPAAIAEANWLAAAGRLVIAVATLLLGLRVWRSVLYQAMGGVAQHLSARVDEAIAAGRRLIDPDKDASKNHNATAANAPKELNYLPRVQWWEKLGLAPATASMAARTSRYWIRDPRLMVSLMSPVMFMGMAVFFEKMEYMPPGMGGFFVYFTPVVMGAVVGALAQYDSTAVWIPVSSALPGRQERLGRLIGSLPVNVALCAIGLAIFVGFTDRSVTDYILMLSLVLTLLLCGSVLTLVMGAVWVYPVQPPGTSPMSTKGTGSMMTTMILQTVQMLGAVVVGLPAVIVCSLAMWNIVPVWLGPLVALIWVTLVCIGGIVWAGKIWDRHSVDVLTKIRSWPGH
ncbi:hypothetical protein [Schaalia suimastitidis]|uniref:hypothetical protein n=1 Tax=Schaalia suimastitidis TaxID=121163 RepID=UPI00041508F6|nr:hypothetical protein [Schaalia suimastitidis]